MRYRHYLTFRFTGPREVVDYSNVDLDFHSTLLDHATLSDAIEATRGHWAERLECHPHQIRIVIANHTVVTL